jgi:hypothetical protein
MRQYNLSKNYKYTLIFWFNNENPLPFFSNVVEFKLTLNFITYVSKLKIHITTKDDYTFNIN